MTAHFREAAASLDHARHGKLTRTRTASFRQRAALINQGAEKDEAKVLCDPRLGAKPSVKNLANQTGSATSEVTGDFENIRQTAEETARRVSPSARPSRA